MAIIETQNLSKHFKVLNRRQGLIGAFKDLASTDYKLIKAVDNISFSIEPGEIVGYIGPNGAGKSTTIKMMTGILKPSEGTILVNGRVPYKNRQRNVRDIGVIFGQRTQLWWDLPVIESFKLLKEIYHVDQQTYDRQMGMFNELSNLTELHSQTVRSLSLGQRMLCDIAASFLHNPKIVFLDEPTIGLDVSIKSKIRGLIRELNHTQNTTIILTTHDMGDVEALCNRIIIIDQGHILFEGDVQRVRQRFGGYRTLKVQLESFSDELVDRIRQYFVDAYGETDNLTVRSREPGWVNITVNQEHIPLMEVLNKAMSNFAIRDAQIVEISLESIIRRLYDGALK